VFLPAALLTPAMSLSGLGARGMSDDEYATWYAAALSPADLAALLPPADAALAPYYLLMHGWTAVAGDTETMLRLPSAMLMGVAAGVVALIGRRLFDAGAGVTAGMMVAGLPSVSRYGQQARPAALALAATVLALLLLLRALDEPTRRRWMLAGCGLVAAGWMHIPGGTAAETQLFGSRPVAAVVVTAALVAAALLWWRHRRPVTLLLAWAVLDLLLSPEPLLGVPAWLLLAGALGHVLARFAPALSLTAMVVVAAVFFVSGPGHQAARRGPVSGAPDFRSAAAVIAAHQRPGDGIAYAGTGRQGRRALGYEARRPGLPRDVLVAHFAQRNGEFEAEECTDPAPCVAGTARIWLVSATGPHQDPLTGMPAATRAYLRATFAHTEFQTFANVRVLVLNRRTSP
jgi:mannosyltransferase